MRPTRVKLHTEVMYQLQCLSMAGTVLHIGAHPTDEDVGMMTYMARHRGMRVVYWSATRGESGENRIGACKEESLGIYRTWESLEAREIDGCEVLYGPFYDFGATTSGEDTLEMWGRDQLICEIVRAICRVQPMIVVSRWSSDTDDEHGQHRAIGLVIEEAFRAAGDPVYVSALAVPPWQPRKLYISAMNNYPAEKPFAFGQRVPAFEREGFVRLNTGVYDTLAGRTYQEQACIGFNSYKTQGVTFAPDAGDFYYYYALHTSLIQTAEHEEDLFDGLDATLTGLSTYATDMPTLYDSLDYIKKHALIALEQYRMGRAPYAANALLVGLSEIRALREQVASAPQTDSLWAIDQFLARKETEFESIAIQCMGLRLECLSDTAHAIPGQQLRVSAYLWNYANIAYSDAVFTLHAPIDWEIRAVASASATTPHTHAVYQVIVAPDAPLSTPYWLRTPRRAFVYAWEGTPWGGLPFGPPTMELSCRISVNEHTLTLRVPVVMREAFAGGFRELPVSVVPPVSLHPDAKEVFLPVSEQAQLVELEVVVRSHAECNGVEGTFALLAPPRWQVRDTQTSVVLGPCGDMRILKVHLSIPPNTASGRYALRYVVQCDGRDYDVMWTPVRMIMPGLPGLPDATNCIQEQFITVAAELSVYLLDTKFVS